jgi:hypothetical protein
MWNEKEMLNEPELVVTSITLSVVAMDFTVRIQFFSYIELQEQGSSVGTDIYQLPAGGY